MFCLTLVLLPSEDRALITIARSVLGARFTGSVSKGKCNGGEEKKPLVYVASSSSIRPRRANAIVDPTLLRKKLRQNVGLVLLRSRSPTKLPLLFFNRKCVRGLLSIAAHGKASK